MGVHKWSWVGVGLMTVLTLIVTGCSTEGDSAQKKEESQVKAKKEEHKEELKIKDTTVSTSWETSDGKVMVHGAAEIKNTGEKPLQFDSVQLKFMGKKDHLLAKEEILAVVPRIIQPGESAYVGGTVQIKKAKSTKDLKDVAVEAEVHPAYISQMKLETESLKKTKDKKKKSTIVKGTVKNPNDKQVESVLVTTAMKDEKGKLVAVLSDYLVPGIPPAGEAKFKADDQKLPYKLTKKATQLEGYAYPVIKEEEKDQEKKK